MKINIEKIKAVTSEIFLTLNKINNNIVFEEKEPDCIMFLNKYSVGTNIYYFQPIFNDLNAYKFGLVNKLLKKIPDLNKNEVVGINLDAWENLLFFSKSNPNINLILYIPFHPREKWFIIKPDKAICLTTVKSFSKNNGIKRTANLLIRRCKTSVRSFSEYLESELRFNRIEVDKLLNESEKKYFKNEKEYQKITNKAFDDLDKTILSNSYTAPSPSKLIPIINSTFNTSAEKIIRLNRLSEKILQEAQPPFSGVCEISMELWKLNVNKNIIMKNLEKAIGNEKSIYIDDKKYLSILKFILIDLKEKDFAYKIKELKLIKDEEITKYKQQHNIYKPDEYIDFHENMGDYNCSTCDWCNNSPVTYRNEAYNLCENCADQLSGE